MYPGIYIILFFIQEVRIAYRKQYNYIIPATYVNVGIFIISMTSYIIYDTLNSAYDIKNYKKYLGSEIQIDSKVIKSDSVITYIGQTKNYIFFYNRKTKESTTYPKDKLVSIKLANN
jgi:hypothetical protein